MAGLLLAELFTDIVVNDASYRVSIKKDQVLAEGLRDKLKEVSKTAAISLAGLVGLSSIVIKLASDAEESGSKFVAVFKEETQAALVFARALAGETQRSVTDIKTSLAGLQDTFVPLGFARQEARLLSQQMVKLAIDVGSFSNVASADVIRDFQSALVGNTETVRKYGIVITQATLEQELLSSGMAKTIEKATEQQKVQARLNLIMAGSTDAVGDAVKTSGSFANTLQGLLANIKELGIALGQVLLDPARDLIDIVRNLIPPITAWIKRNKEILTTIAKMAGILLVIAAVMSTVVSITVAVTVAVINLTIAWVAQILVLKGFSLILGRAVTSLSLMRLALVSTIKLLLAFKVALGLLALTVVAVTFAWTAYTKRLDDIPVIIAAKNEIDRINASLKIMQERLRGGGGQREEEDIQAAAEARRLAAIRKEAREKARKEEEKDRAAALRVSASSFRTEEALLEKDFALQLLTTQDFISEKKALLEKGIALNLRVLEAELRKEREVIKENEKQNLIEAEEAAMKLSDLTRERETRRLIFAEEAFRKRIALEKEANQLIAAESRKRDREEQQRRRDALKAIKDDERQRIASIRKLQRILIQDQRKIRKEKQEEVLGAKSKLKEAQQRARETQISFSGLTDRLRSLQIALGGGKENKVVTELRRQLKVSEASLKKQDELIDAIKDQPATVGV